MTISPRGGVPALVKAPARAFGWRRMLETGGVTKVREIAAAKIDEFSANPCHLAYPRDWGDAV